METFVFLKQHVCVEGCGVTEVLHISCAPTVAVVLVQLQVSYLRLSNAHFLLDFHFSSYFREHTGLQ